MTPYVVLKFGGTSVSSRERWDTIAAQLRALTAEDVRPVVVCSAIRGISDALESIARGAAGGDPHPALATIEARHRALADELGLDGEALLRSERDELGRLALGAALIGEVSPRLHARILSFGELMLTRLGAAFLASQGISTTWLDARDVLHTVDEVGRSEHRRYLSATVDHRSNVHVQKALSESEGDVLLTQGFIAGNPAGETVLLGRGGSDTSAACFASILDADRCEIWTDVPGMFSANPRQIPSARLLRRLDYDEAQEIASSGAKVLHPACIAPVRDAGIPLHIRCTPTPDMPGTVISGDGGDGGAQVKAISARSGITLISMDTVGMWQQVGFLADAFAHFKRRGLSIDLVSTSETSVTVSLDPAANGLDPTTVEVLLADLAPICRARAIGPCASISLVGRRIRAILHRLGPALELFEEQQIHLVSQASSDLNLTFVVDEEQAERLVRDLHLLLFKDRRSDDSLGPSWADLFAESDDAVQAVAPWWRVRRADLLELAAQSSPVYVYNGPTLDERAARMTAISGVERVFYAMKANDNPQVLRRLASRGLGFECVSLGELDLVARELPDVPADRVLFTPNFAPRDEYAEALTRGHHVTLDSVYPLRAWPEVFAGRSILLRIDPGHGRGHHAHVRTAGAHSKFGIAPERLDEVARLAEASGVRVVGLHAHAGSGIRSADNWRRHAVFLASVADRFPDVRVLDLGGGFGVPEHPGDDPLDLDAVGETLLAFKEAHPELALWLEPGRFLVAEAGVLLTRVTQTKTKQDTHYVGVDAGMNALIRPALYGSWHEIANLSRIDAPRSLTANVVGPICESGDTLGHARRLPPTNEGDVVLIATTGAYGRVMSSQYNRRTPPLEVLLD